MASISMEEFEEIVRHTMDALPERLRPHLENLVVEIADEPDEELLLQAGFTEEEIEEGDTLFGLFDPMELPTTYSGDAIDTDAMLHRLWIFRRPHEEEFDDPVRLRTEIRKTVIHELAHHFHWTDRDLEEFDDNPDPFGNGGIGPAKGL